jgi:hypothetical protein
VAAAAVVVADSAGAEDGEAVDSAVIDAEVEDSAAAVIGTEADQCAVVAVDVAATAGIGLTRKQT